MNSPQITHTSNPDFVFFSFSNHSICVRCAPLIDSNRFNYFKSRRKYSNRINRLWLGWQSNGSGICYKWCCCLSFVLRCLVKKREREGINAYNSSFWRDLLPLFHSMIQKCWARKFQSEREREEERLIQRMLNKVHAHRSFLYFVFWWANVSVWPKC